MVVAEVADADTALDDVANPTVGAVGQGVAKRGTSSSMHCEIAQNMAMRLSRP